MEGNPINFFVDISSPRHASTETNNDARREIARILRDLANKVEGMGDDDCGTVRESNGNKVGHWSIDLSEESDD